MPRDATRCHFGTEANLEQFAVPAMARIATALKERHPEVLGMQASERTWMVMDGKMMQDESLEV